MSLQRQEQKSVPISLKGSIDESVDKGRYHLAGCRSKA
jgi:hypothetical protein